MDKRDFLRTVGGTMSAALLGDALEIGQRVLPTSGSDAPRDTWEQLRARYRLPEGYVDLEHGYYSRMCNDVLDAFVQHARDVNRDAARYMRTRQVADKRRARDELAKLAGCGADELIITRNTTESLDTIIAGFPWRAGDEAVMANTDYHAMLSMFGQVARRHGVKQRFVDIPLDPRSDDEVVDCYANAITERTRMLMVCHIVNVTGHVLPVRKITEMAHERGVRVLCDGAHAFGHLDFAIPELGCDYYGASLHKWLGAPLGSGLLYVQRERIEELWPLFGDHHADDSIDKLNHTGTHPPHTDLGILDAIQLHRELGPRKKEQRLRSLQRHWTAQVRGERGIRLNTPAEASRTCAIANVAIDGVDPGQLSRRLFDDHHIHTVAIDYGGVRGVRITPAAYTRTEELDQLVAALRTIARG